MYVIMRKLKGYTHFDFLRDDFMCSQYFLLLDLVNKEVEAEKAASKKATKGKK